MIFLAIIVVLISVWFFYKTIPILIKLIRSKKTPSGKVKTFLVEDKERVISTVISEKGEMYQQTYYKKDE